MNQRVSKGKYEQLKNLLNSWHTCFSNICKRIMRKKASIEVLYQIVP